MAPIDGYDSEIGRGRGRQDDSSSSRDSSPARKPTRSFTPTGSDDDTVIPPMVDDDTPPPPERPIIRQAVAFSVDQAPAAISTYEAAPVADPPSFFLPGQAVPIPKKPKVSKPRKQGATKRPRRPEVFAQQTSRFRLETYDPTPTADPPIHHGNGPYSSLYRGAAPPADGEARQNSPASISNSSHSSNPTATTITPSNTPVQAMGRSGTAEKARRPSAQPVPSNKQSNHNMSHSPAPNGQNGSANGSASGSYYRRNYDVEMQDPSRPVSSQGGTGSSAYSVDEPGTNFGDSGHHRSKPQLPTVTLLIEDLRSGEVDHQLAELQVSLRSNGRPEDGYTVDAKDLTEQLQKSPSRVDGPARLFTMRGKYRQFILRVSADNVDEYISTNLAIKPDKSLEVHVESLGPPGAVPPPRRATAPRERSITFDEYDDYDEPRDHRMVESRRARYNPQEGTRKRRRSPSFDSFNQYDHPPRHASGSYSSSKAPRHSYAKEESPRSFPRQHQGVQIREREHAFPSKRRSHTKEPVYPRYRSPSPEYAPSPSPPRYERQYARRGNGDDSASEESDHSPEAEFLREVDLMLQRDMTLWTDFFKAMAGNTARDHLKRYQVINTMFDAWVGKHPINSKLPIQKEDILDAMKINDERFLGDCTEMIELWSWYGKGGTRYEDEKTVNLVESGSQPENPNANLGKRLLRYLREADESWRKGHPSTSPRASMSGREVVQSADPRQGKGMFVQ